LAAPDAAVELLFLWHHHQPDYRSPATAVARLPWVRLHAVKDYLDMALRLERHPGLRATFNFVPVLLDQLDDAVAGRGDALFDAIARPIESLEAELRAEVSRRCAAPPPRLRERWPRYAALCRKVARGGAPLDDRELGALEAWFLIAWLDPMFHGDPEVREAMAGPSGPAVAHVAPLLALHARRVAEVLPAYRRLAERGQIELSTSPYAHPILPLLVDTACARRARPDLHLPDPGLAAPEDAERQIERARLRHARAFGAAPLGMWPSEGSVSPEMAELVAAQGLRWIATDEAVLWRSLRAGERKRAALHRPWCVRTAAGPLTVLFRDHELSDRIGFVYQNWEAGEAVADFVARLRRIGAEHAGERPPLVTVALDGENCWEHYPSDGGPFLDGLYAALAAAPDIRTVTPGDVLAARGPGEPLANLHSGSWIDADFHIWIGHPEKNAAWERIARARADLVASGQSEADAPAAWESLHAAEGSDWFWWLGVDHHTSDKALFDALLREHLAATYERRGAQPPDWLAEPITRFEPEAGEGTPLGYLRPRIDGRVTSYYEWASAGRCRAAAGAAMHRGESALRDLYYGFDERSIHLRLDIATAARTPSARAEIRVRRGPKSWGFALGVMPGAAAIEIRECPEDFRPEAGMAGAKVASGQVLELSVPLAPLGLAPGDEIAIVAVLRDGDAVLGEITAGDPDPIRITDLADEAAQWSA